MTQRKVILLVEDNRDELMIYTTLLSHHGYAVLAATDIDSALRIAREHKPDLAIVDVNLNDPDRDGCDLIEELRADPATRPMPVIAHTAYADIFRESLERSGCENVLHKPTSPAVLLDAIVQKIGPAG